jgi:hypothetical protein
MKQLLTTISCLLIAWSILAQQQKVWLDADTGNEMDDLYAIVRLLKQKEIDVIGLSSAHFNNPDLLVFEKWNAYDAKGLNTIVESQRLNVEILSVLNRLDIPHPIGADRQIGRAWGQQDPRPSPASEAIIAAAKQIRPGQKLDVITTGAVTNIATAVMLAPEIIPNIRVFSLGAKYEPKREVWNKNEFNIRNDLNAFDFLLDLSDLDFVIMSLEAAFPLQFDREMTYQQLDEQDEMERILENRWREHNPQDKVRIMWDLALVEAYLNPELSQIKTVKPPKENKRKRVKVFVKIDEKALADDFWKTLKSK